MHDRHVRALGPEIPSVLGDLRVAIIGCGGTGSAVAEQLERLGVRDFVLVDPDRLSDSNTTRVYGSALLDVGRLKVELLGEHLRVAPGAVINCVEGSVCQRQVAERIVGADVVFDCTDDEAGRMRLSRFAYAYLTLLIDCRVKISADGAGIVDDVTGRVTILDTRSAWHRARSGCLHHCGGVACGQRVARTARRVWRRSTASEVLLRVHDRAVSTNHQKPSARSP